MEAMILAAGLGSRLRPITDDIPKCLVPVNDVPMLERVAKRLIAAGVDRLIINVHHYADQVVQFVERRYDFGVDVAFSFEHVEPLDTGGGLKQAAHLFRRDAPFFIHNSDVLSDVDLRALYRQHERAAPLATLAVRRPEDDRYLLFDDEGTLCGYRNRTRGEIRHRRCAGAGDGQARDFCGIHVVDPRILDMMTEEGVFSIIFAYMRLAENGETVRAFDIGDVWWTDVGTIERLEEARRRLE